MISVVIPVFNEIDSLPDLVDQLKSVLELMKEWEILFVDDGSSDGSTEFLTYLSENDERIMLIQFHRNYGKSAALAEGFKLAKGQYLITMDADLQDDPAEFPNLIKKLEDGYDLVSGWKKNRMDPISKRYPSKLFNFVACLMTGVKIHDFNCGLKIYRKAVVNSLDLYGGRHRYIPALAGHNKFRISEIVVNHRPRVHGVTKYGGSRLFHGFFDLITIIFMNRYTQQPLHLFGFFGLFCGFASFGVESYVLWKKLYLHHSFYEHLALMLFGAMLFILGLWFFSIGLIAEMISRWSQEQEPRIKQVV